MKDIKLTILTPSYNRTHTLTKLYESLIGQSSQEFRWMLIDDGSTDSTEDMAERWIQEKKINMVYIRKENGGKHTALNMAVEQIETELTFIVDSDDYLTEDAVEKILSYHEKYRSETGLCGYSFLRMYSDGGVNTAYFPENEKIDTYVNVRINGGIGGDKAEVFYTEVLKKYPFPVYPGEKFLPEDLVWVEMSGPYNMVHINEGIYICDYLEGGLTKSGRKMKMNSPLGMRERSRVYLADQNVCLKTKVKMMLLYIVYGSEAGISKKQQREEAVDRKMYGLLLPIGKIIYQYWKMKY